MSGEGRERALWALGAILTAIGVGLLIACLMAIIFTSWWAPVFGAAGTLALALALQFSPDPYTKR